LRPDPSSFEIAAQVVAISGYGSGSQRPEETTMTDLVRTDPAPAAGATATGGASARPGTTAAGDIIAARIRQLGDAVTRGVEQVGEEINERTAGGARGAKLLGAAGVTGAVTLGAAVSLPIILLRRVMPGWAVALLLAGGGGAATYVLARRGLDEIGAAVPDAGAIKDAAREAMGSDA
jgi:hypothetical protein